MMRRMIFSLLLIAAFAPVAASAHAFGLTYTATTTAGYIDVDYSDLFLVAERSGQFTFRLFADEERTDEIEVTSVWARIEQKRDDRALTLFSGYITKPQFGTIGMHFVFPTAGEYVLHTRYYSGDEQLSEASFPLSVEGLPVAWSDIFFKLDIWLGALLGLGIGFVVLKFIPVPLRFR